MAFGLVVYCHRYPRMIYIIFSLSLIIKFS
jgi:hypothetical protein